MTKTKKEEKQLRVKLEIELGLIEQKVKTAKEMLEKKYYDALSLKAGEIEQTAVVIMKMLDLDMYNKTNS